MADGPHMLIFLKWSASLFQVPANIFQTQKYALPPARTELLSSAPSPYKATYMANVLLSNNNLARIEKGEGKKGVL